MLIRDAELLDGRRLDVRVGGDRILALGVLLPLPEEAVIDARGGLLLPGLHDHHIHLAALAASLTSVSCGPPDVRDADDLAACLRPPGTGWLRGTGYHESVAGMLDARTLDRIAGDRPVRVQHRSGRMWFLNSAALGLLLECGLPAPDRLEREGGRYTGRLFDADGWLRRALASAPPGFAEASAQLAAFGITGITDMSPLNDPAMATHFAAEMSAGALLQSAMLAGAPSLSEADFGPLLALGPVKLHLHEADLPPLADAVALVAHAHGAGRAVAIHCVSQVELLFALAAIEEAGAAAGDRIEHASIATPADIARIAALGLGVTVQPHFISERGDMYRAEVDPDAQPHLYRLRSFLDAGVPLAGGSDAPFGKPDPWAAMTAAVSRRTAGGLIIGAAEALSAEEALALFLRAPQALDRTRRVEAGAPADLCLLDRGWSRARSRLSADLVRATVVAGRIVHDSVDQTPAARHVRADAAA